MSIKKIVIFNPFGMGDVLFSTPLLRNLKAIFPKSLITYICNRRTHLLLDNSTFVDDVIVFEKDEWRKILKESKLGFVKHFFSFYWKIRSANYDVMFDLSINSQYGLFFKLTGIPMRIGFNYRRRGRFLTHSVELPYGYSQKHVARYHLELLKFLGKDFKEYPFNLNLSTDIVDAARDKLSGLGIDFSKTLIGVCPGSGDSWQKTAKYRRWPKEYYAELCLAMVKDLQGHILLFGSVSEKTICDSIASELPSDRAANLCGEISLSEFCAMLSLCGVLITNDGGPFHIGQALNKKTIVFFGPVDKKVYGPYPDESLSTVLITNFDCQPCYRSFKFGGCEFDNRCLRQIKPQEAILAVKKRLGL